MKNFNQRVEKYLGENSIMSTLSLKGRTKKAEKKKPQQQARH